MSKVEQTITRRINNAEALFPNITKVSSHDLSIKGLEALKKGIIDRKDYDKLEKLQYELERGTYGGGGDRLAVAKKNKVKFVALE